MKCISPAGEHVFFMNDDKQQECSICHLLESTIRAEAVRSPMHYNTGKIEVWDFIEDQQLDYFLGNSVKYICRARHKGKFEEDIAKAIQFLQRAK